MHDFSHPVPVSVIKPTVKFESNVDFQKHDTKHDTDAGFMKFSKKSRIQPKGDARVTREVISTLLASTQGDECVDECIEKLLAEEISYNDLGSLTQTDLELMGFKNRQQQEELLGFLKLLPNQDPTYNKYDILKIFILAYLSIGIIIYSILSLPEAKCYNRKIFNSANVHLETMRSALSVANYKLKIMPVDDVIVGEKSFASRFVLEALSELKSVTDEIDAQLEELDELVTNKKNNLQKPKTKPFGVFAWILMTSITTSAVAAIWYWKYSK